MDTRLRTSFIPKKTLILKSEAGGGRVSINLFLSFGMIVFFLMIALSAGVYLYKVVIQKKITQEGAELEKARKAFEPSLIADVKRLDNRITTARIVLDNHIVALPIFDLLETLTLKTVRFTKFDYKNAKSGPPTIQLDGEAKGYSSVALLSDSFAGDERIKNPAFSNLNLNETGGVKFSFQASLDPSMVVFKKYFGEGEKPFDLTETP
jgi:hypothetical protein